MISVIIPVKNEEQCIESTLKHIQNANCLAELEIIVVDGGSQDKTCAISKPYAKVFKTQSGRAHQLNLGARHAQGDILFFAHADMIIPEKAFDQIQERIKQGFDGGGFSNKFVKHNQWIKLLGRIMNLRLFSFKESSDKGIFFGDNGIFVKNAVFHKLKGFKNIPIMEDYDFSLKLKRHYNITHIKHPPLILSARRHEKSGFIKTRFQWIMIKRLYQLGISPDWLAKWYSDVR